MIMLFGFRHVSCLIKYNMVIYLCIDIYVLVFWVK